MLLQPLNLDNQGDHDYMQMLGLLLGADYKRKLIKDHGIVPKSRLVSQAAFEQKVDLKTLCLSQSLHDKLELKYYQI